MIKPLSVKCKSYFSNKHSKADADIVLNKKGDIIFKNKDIPKTFNEYFEFMLERLIYLFIYLFFIYLLFIYLFTYLFIYLFIYLQSNKNL